MSASDSHFPPSDLAAAAVRIAELKRRTSELRQTRDRLQNEADEALNAGDEPAVDALLQQAEHHEDEAIELSKNQRTEFEPLIPTLTRHVESVRRKLRCQGVPESSEFNDDLNAAWLHLWRKINKFDAERAEHSGFEGWSYRVVENCIRDRRRKAAKRLRDERSAGSLAVATSTSETIDAAQLATDPNAEDPASNLDAWSDADLESLESWPPRDRLIALFPIGWWDELPPRVRDAWLAAALRSDAADDEFRELSRDERAAELPGFLGMTDWAYRKECGRKRHRIVELDRFWQMLDTTVQIEPFTDAQLQRLNELAGAFERVVVLCGHALWPRLGGRLPFAAAFRGYRFRAGFPWLRFVETNERGQRIDLLVRSTRPDRRINPAAPRGDAAHRATIERVLSKTQDVIAELRGDGTR